MVSGRYVEVVTSQMSEHRPTSLYTLGFWGHTPFATPFWFLWKQQHLKPSRNFQDICQHQWLASHFPVNHLSQEYVPITNRLVGGWPTPLKKMNEFVNWDDDIPKSDGKISQSCSRKTTNQQKNSHETSGKATGAFASPALRPRFLASGKQLKIDKVGLR